jgi:hypothetical protein
VSVPNTKYDLEEIRGGRRIMFLNGSEEEIPEPNRNICWRNNCLEDETGRIDKEGIPKSLTTGDLALFVRKEVGCSLGEPDGGVEGGAEGGLLGQQEGRVEGRLDGSKLGQEDGTYEGNEEGRLVGQQNGKEEGQEEGWLLGEQDG